MWSGGKIASLGVNLMKESKIEEYIIFNIIKKLINILEKLYFVIMVKLRFRLIKDQLRQMYNKVENSPLGIKNNSFSGPFVIKTSIDKSNSPLIIL